MSYWTHELSADRGEPAELYEFLVYGGGSLEQTLRCTPSQTPIQHLGEVYTPLAIARDGVELGGDIGRIQFRLRVPIGSPPARLFGLRAPHVVVRLRIWRLQPGGWLLFWTGRITGSSIEDDTVVLRADPFAGVLQRAGLRARYQTGCRHLLYGPGCGVDRSQFAVPATLTAVFVGANTQPGDMIAVEFETTAAPAGWPGGHPIEHPVWGHYFTLGVLRCPGKGRAMIHFSDMTDLNPNGRLTGVLGLDRSIPGLAPADAVVLEPGCAKTLQHCANKFNNLPRFGGFPWIPAKNPFAGDAIA